MRVHKVCARGESVPWSKLQATVQPASASSAPDRKGPFSTGMAASPNDPASEMRRRRDHLQRGAAESQELAP